MNTKEISDKDLVTYFKQLHTAITVSDCFNAKDITDHLNAGNELLDRGYSIDVNKSVKVSKKGGNK